MGNVKDHLEPVVGALDMSVPTVVYGRNFQTRSKIHRSWLIAPFQVEGQTFEVRVCLEAKS
jgi:chemotaxis protein CheX